MPEGLVGVFDVPFAETITEEFIGIGVDAFNSESTDSEAGMGIQRRCGDVINGQPTLLCELVKPLLSRSSYECSHQVEARSSQGVKSKERADSSSRPGQRKGRRRFEEPAFVRARLG